jgi:threonine dehydrogenase-like Zn-dependent dehydrogenase
MSGLAEGSPATRSAESAGPPARARAAVLVEPGRYEIQEFAVPPPPPGGAIVRILASGICGTDKHTFQGHTGQYAGAPTRARVRFPIIQGHENVGELVALGGPLRDFGGHPLALGDRVVVAPNVPCGSCWYCRRGAPYALCERTVDYGNTLSAADPPHLVGGWAEVLVVLPGTPLFRLPEEFPTSLAVLVEPMAVTVGLDWARHWSALPGEAFASGDTVAVVGVGPLGLCHVLKARLLGAGHVVVIDPSPARRAMAERLGADVALDPGSTEREERLAAVRDLTGGRGADVVVETAGVPEVMPEVLELVRPGGIVLAVGNFADLGEVSLSPHRHFVSRGIRLLGVAGDDLRSYPEAIRGLLAARQRYPVDDLVREGFPLDQVAAAMARALAADSLKVWIKP